MALSLKHLKIIYQQSYTEQDFGTFMKYLGRCFRYIYLDFTSEEFRPTPGRWMIVIMFVTFYALVVNAVFTENRNDMVLALLFVAFFLMTLPKVTIIMLYYDRLRALTKIAIENSKYHPKMSEAENKIRIRYIFMASVITRLLTGFYNVTISFSFLVPLSLTAIGKYILPFIYKIPFVRFDEARGYFIHYAAMMFQLFLMYMISLTIDLLFYYFTIYISYRLDLCKACVKEIGTEKTEAERSKNLQKTIKMHIETYEYLRECASIFELNIFCQSFGTMFLLTCALYTLIFNPYAFWIGFLINSVLVQFFTYCHFGQLVVTQVEEISQELYCSNWINLLNEEQKTAMLFLVHTQLKVGFNAYGWFEMSYDTFASVVKAAFGYFTFLKSMM